MTRAAVATPAPIFAIRLAEPADIPAYAALRAALWPDAPATSHAAEVATALRVDDPDNLCLVALVGTVPVGFAEASIRRDYVNGCETTPVAFLEGIYVAPDHRRDGLGAALVAAVRDWGRARQCHELASDSLIDNVAAHRFHRAAGFTEMERVVYFKQLID